MRLINITPITKRRVKEMAKTMIPGVGYVKVTTQGLVILKKKWYSLRRNVVPLTDLCIKEFPRRISQKANENNKGYGYASILSNNIANIVYINSYTDSTEFNLINYLWKMYNDLYKEIPVILYKIEESLESIENKYGEWLPQLSIFSSKVMYGIDHILNKYKREKEGNILIKKIKNIRKFLEIPEKTETLEISLNFY